MYHLAGHEGVIPVYGLCRRVGKRYGKKVIFFKKKERSPYCALFRDLVPYTTSRRSSDTLDERWHLHFFYCQDGGLLIAYNGAPYAAGIGAFFVTEKIDTVSQK